MNPVSWLCRRHDARVGRARIIVVTVNECVQLQMSSWRCVSSIARGTGAWCVECEVRGVLCGCADLAIKHVLANRNAFNIFNFLCASGALEIE